MSIHDETFEQFYARISAHRKEEIAGCADPDKRAELVAWDKHFETEWRTSWDAAVTRNSRFKSSVTEEELADRRREYNRANYVERERTDYEEHSPYRVIDGKAW